MTILEIFAILTIHFVADFIFQDEDWAINKSKDFFKLTTHTAVYSILWFLPIVILSKNWYIGLDFVIITFVLHTITDYFTSKIVKEKFDIGHYGSSIPNLGAFTVIGFDQLLHYVQLFLTYYILIK